MVKKIRGEKKMYNSKEKFNEFVWSLPRKEATKLPMFNILMFAFEGLFGKIFNQNINTKEQANKLYPNDEYQVLFRILDGKLLKDNKPDSYAWKKSKIETYDSKRIGLSLFGFINYYKVLRTISSKEERKMFHDFFKLFRVDLSLIFTPAEERECVIITQELFDAGLTHVINDWENKPDENGNWAKSELHVGDALIITKDGAYQVQADVFAETYRLK